MLLRLLSINIWDLPFVFPGQHRAARRRHLLRDLPALDADVICIQEAFSAGLKERVARALPAMHTDAYATRRRRTLPFFPSDRSGGLFTLSRWPITNSRMQPWKRIRLVKLDERIGRKGVLWTEIQTPAGAVLVGNLHAHAGRHAADARARAAQLRELLAQAEAAHAGRMIIAGDLNIDPAIEPPDVRPHAFELLAQAGFVEVAGGERADISTVVPRRNRYARVNPFRHHHDRRLTHVFYRGAGLKPAGPPVICLDDPPVSDHFGLMATLELDGQSG